ncbi:putative Sin3 associated polypeptide p18-domain-containing protein [Seiridium unicorne]|uniref:Sin3 associated polypeptide p18-domain-containing protein n=1 Tax=Seiridium unicorne TaxID=138068 RepID=A0ABR2UR42_9PEZI
MDRRANPPFALRLFYRTGAFHRPDEFSSSHLPPYLTIHTWPSCTLDELSHHLSFTAPSILPDPAIGTRLSFRLIFPDTRSTVNQAPMAQGPKYMVKDLGSVVIGDSGPGLDVDDPSVPKSLAGADGGDATKTLADARFVVGDYLSVAILPPLGDGSVAPASAARMGRGAGAGEAGTVVGRAPGLGGRDRENGFGGRRGGRGGRPDGFGRGGRGGSISVPMGEWRRGEQLPEAPRGGRAPIGDWRRADGPPDMPYGRNRGRGRY